MLFRPLQFDKPRKTVITDIPVGYPWFWGWDERKADPTDFTGGKKFTGDRWNDLHDTNALKQQARDLKQASFKEPK